MQKVSVDHTIQFKFFFFNTETDLTHNCVDTEGEKKRLEEDLCRIVLNVTLMTRSNKGLN